MTQKNLILSFTAKLDEKQEMSIPAEIASVTFLAESQRKKPSFFHEKPERIGCMSKVYYPFWVTQIGDSSIIIDGLNKGALMFQFDEPKKTSTFIEELKRSSINPQKFFEVLETQSKTIQDFTAIENVSFEGIISDKELLTFFQTCLKTGTLQQGTEGADIIPADISAQAATQKGEALVNCLRIMQADARGLQYALTVMRAEVEFHKEAAINEIEHLKDKCDAEINAIRPAIEKNVAKLTQKANKSKGILQKASDRKIANMVKRREVYLRRLQIAEQRKGALQRRIDTAKKKKRPSSGSYALKKYESDIDSYKKEIKVITDELERLRREATVSIKQKEEEFHLAITQEESMITRIQTDYEAKINKMREQMNDLNSHVATMNVSLSSYADKLKRQSVALRSQVEIDWKLEDYEGPILVQLPVYIIKYMKGTDEERYSLITPIEVLQDVSVLDGLKKMLSLNPGPKLKAILRPKNKKLQETVSLQVLQKLQGNAEFRIQLNEVCRLNNLINQNSFAQTLNEGLDEIEKKGYMTPEEASDLCKNLMEETA